MNTPEGVFEGLHGYLLANVLSFVDVETLRSCAMCCREWFWVVHRDDSVWRLLTHRIWEARLLHVRLRDRSGTFRPLLEDLDEGEYVSPYDSFKALAMDRNRRFSVPCMQIKLQLQHARRSMANALQRAYICNVKEIVWNRPSDEICLLFEVQGDPGKVRMPVTSFLFRRILDEGGNKYDDINVSPRSRTEYTGGDGLYRGYVAWRAEDIFEANQELVSRCESSHLIAKVPAERVSGVRLSLCFGLPSQGPVAVVGTMMDQTTPCRELDLITSATAREQLELAFRGRLHDGISYRGIGEPFL
mmetsp:Transcript_14541/g.34527  ORF Transcript_14541/g.34527 Transcript_14541/m.34527 type:complete len:302 (-) Transcript_14541:445-1350(-)